MPAQGPGTGEGVRVNVSNVRLVRMSEGGLMSVMCPSTGPGPAFHHAGVIPVSLLADTSSLTLLTVLEQTRLKPGG